MIGLSPPRGLGHLAASLLPLDLHPPAALPWWHASAGGVSALSGAETELADQQVVNRELAPTLGQ